MVVEILHASCLAWYLKSLLQKSCKSMLLFLVRFMVNAVHWLKLKPKMEMHDMD